MTKLNDSSPKILRLREVMNRISVSRSTIYDWLSNNDEFSDKYRKATEQREDFHFEEMMEIADKVLPESAEVAKAKLQIDTRKWVLSRMNPKKYGDKQQMEHSGDVAVNMISELMNF